MDLLLRSPLLRGSHPHITFEDPHAGQVSGDLVTTASGGSLISLPIEFDSSASVSALLPLGRPRGGEMPIWFPGPMSLNNIGIRCRT